MKQLSNISDRADIARIESIRVSYQICYDAFEELCELLKSNDQKPNFSEVIKLLRKAWELIDFANRFATLLIQMRGMKHKDPRMKALIDLKPTIDEMRNLVQHLTTELLSLPANPAPVLGALTWTSADRLTGRTACVGYLPSGTNVNSAAFDRTTGLLVPDIILNAMDHAINLSETMNVLKGANEQFQELLISNSWLGDEESKPSIFDVNFKIVRSSNTDL